MMLQPSLATEQMEPEFHSTSNPSVLEERYAPIEIANCQDRNRVLDLSGRHATLLAQDGCSATKHILLLLLDAADHSPNVLSGSLAEPARRLRHSIQHSR